MLMSTKVVWNIDSTGMLNVLFWQFLWIFLRFTLFLMVLSWVLSWILVMIYLNLLSLRCCCLYFKWNLPLSLGFFLVKSYCTCQLLISSFATPWEFYNFFPVPSVIRYLQFRISHSKFAVYNPEGFACYQSYPLCPPH